MKILVINPNSSEIVTGVIEKSARKKARPSTELVFLTNPAGTKNIDCAFADYQSSWSHIRACLKKVEEIQADAVVLAGFGNVGINALKEALTIPVDQHLRGYDGNGVSDGPQVHRRHDAAAVHPLPGRASGALRVQGQMRLLPGDQHQRRGSRLRTGQDAGGAEGGDAARGEEVGGAR